MHIIVIVVNDIIVILKHISKLGTRKRLLNTKIGPSFTDSKKSNVDERTILEPCDKKILAKLAKNCNIYHRLILLMKLDTQSYYNLRLILGLECKTYL